MRWRACVPAKPVAYLTGVREFWGLPIGVSPAVLIPRPETEALVELALARVAADRDVRILDLGTGSGAIALALAHERPRAEVLATDVSAAALAIARENARRLALPNVEFRQSVWYASLFCRGARPCSNSSSATALHRGLSRTRRRRRALCRGRR
jgi:release factor glutamine methyltransferase